MKDKEYGSVASTIGACFLGVAAMICLFFGEYSIGMITSGIFALIGVAMWCADKLYKI